MGDEEAIDHEHVLFDGFQMTTTRPYSLDRLNLNSEFAMDDVIMDDAAIPTVSSSSKPLKRGPARNCRFPIMHTNLNLPAHPERDKKEFMIRSKQKISLLSGTHVSRMPKTRRPVDESPSTRVLARQWDKEATEWASFFMCLLIP